MAPTAPPIEGELWINTPALERRHLLGRTVVLVFWAAGCEASHHRVRQVQDLVRAAQDHDLTAIVVHTPRMPCDENPDRLHHTVRRLGIDLPVVHDPRYRTWSRYHPPGWPSTAVIDPNGRVSGIVPGCDRFDLVETAVADARSRPPRRRRRSDRGGPGTPLMPRSVEGDGNDDGGDGTGDGGGGGDGDTIHADWTIDIHADRTIDILGDRTVNATALRYPEGLATIVDRRGRRWFAVADTGHDRVVIGSLDHHQRVLAAIVSLTGFDQPSAVEFLDASTVVVVERGTNLVSAVDLATGTRRLVTDQLVRPTAVARDLDGSLIIADGVANRLHRATPNSRRSAYLVLPVAGSGRTGTRPGFGLDADLAQPCSLVRTPAGVVFCDAASSNVRLLTDAGEVVNITDSELYDFGLVDGLAHRARLERPSGIGCLADGSLVVSDSGNNRLRRFHQRRVETLGLGGLNGPVGVVGHDDNRVLVTDTNHHRLLLVDTVRHDAWTVSVQGVALPPVDAEAAVVNEPDPMATGQVSSGRAMSAT